MLFFDRGYCLPCLTECNIFLRSHFSLDAMHYELLHYLSYLNHEKKSEHLIACLGTKS